MMSSGNCLQDLVLSLIHERELGTWEPMHYILFHDVVHDYGSESNQGGASLTRRELLVRAALGFAGALACGTPRDPVLALLDELVAAAEARDAARFAAQLSPAFQGPAGMERLEAESALRRYFAAYESIGLDLYAVETEREQTATRVRCRVEFSGQARKALGFEGLLPPSAAYRFDLELTRESGTFRVSRAAWEALDVSPQP